MTNNMVTVKGLTKKYKNITAVNNISLSIQKGSIFAFLGTNGAGKSTTINILTTALKPTAGEVEVAGYRLGRDDAKIRQATGVVFQQSLLDPLLTVRENLQVRASFYHIKDFQKKVGELSKLVGLEGFIDRRYGKLSGGQRRRADIARALIHTPEILFLDEPTTGLDPKSREDVWKTIADLQSKTELTVFLTTHYMEEAERADDVYVINQGEIVAHDTPQALRVKYTKDVLTLVSNSQGKLEELLTKGGHQLEAGVKKLEVYVDSAKQALGLLKEHEDLIEDFEFKHGNMDDVFLSLTNVEGGKS